MKNKILLLTIAAIGALLITASNGFAERSFGNDVDTACAPATPFAGDCNVCHVPSSRSDYTDAMDAYVAGGTTLTDYFCPTQPTCNDNDGDGYGNPGDSSCAKPGTDCNDSNASINPGAVENCTDRIDNDCDFLIDSDDPSAVNCPVCTDSDNDGYNLDGGACGPVDCNDNDEFISPGEPEDCNDGIDNDCDGNIDSEDLDCYTCGQYTDRGSCKADPSCNYSRKRGGCYEVVDGSIYTDQSSCEDAFGRWNKKKETCTIR
jgi:hypothetical protein